MSKKEIKANINNEKYLGPIVDLTFSQADINQNGTIEKCELKILMENIAKDFGLPTPTDSEITEELIRLDTNKDGVLSKHEFKVFVKELLLIMADAQ